MRVVPFIAETPAAALAQIQAHLGPEAVVLSVRPVPATGLSRLWRRNRAVEVIAAVDDTQDSGSSPSPAASEFSSLTAPASTPGWPEPPPERRSAEVSVGSSPEVPGSFSPSLRFSSRETPSPSALLGPASSLPPLVDPSGRPHVFIGPPGAGKTTLLCKLLANKVLNSQSTVQVWRLDGETANTAELLDVYGEMFGLTVERFWKASSRTAELQLIDLPGTETGDMLSQRALQAQLQTLCGPRVHLVLNAAYDINVLYEQIRAFSPFKPEDVSFTHLDEEPRREKLWSLLEGTNCSLRFLSGGQKIPGEFQVSEGAPLGQGGRSL